MVYLVCSLMAFFNTNVVSFLGKIYYETKLYPFKPSWLVNGYNKDTKMVLVRVATTIQNLLNMACGLAHTQI